MAIVGGWLDAGGWLDVGGWLGGGGWSGGGPQQWVEEEGIRKDRSMNIHVSSRGAQAL